MVLGFFTALLTFVASAMNVGAPAQPLVVHPPALHAHYGRVTIPALHLVAPISQGATHRDLATNVGHLPSTYGPGMGGTIALFGHDVTPWGGMSHGPFHDIPSLHRGARIIVRMPYGVYRYRVVSHHLVSGTRWAAFRARHAGERLLLATCWPRFTSLQRWVVVARPA